MIVTRRLPEATEARMLELFDARLNIDDTPMDVAALAAAMEGLMCWCPRSPTRSTLI